MLQDVVEFIAHAFFENRLLSDRPRCRGLGDAGALSSPARSLHCVAVAIGAPDRARCVRGAWPCGWAAWGGSGSCQTSGQPGEKAERGTLALARVAQGAYPVGSRLVRTHQSPFDLTPELRA